MSELLGEVPAGIRVHLGGGDERSRDRWRTDDFKAGIVADAGWRSGGTQDDQPEIVVYCRLINVDLH